MPTRVTVLWERLRTGYWFVPTVMLLSTMALALGMVQIDCALPSDGLPLLGWTYSGGAEGARQTLATIAASMLGVAGVTFSITIVALTLASQQYGPRLLRGFLRDRGNQITLGTFISTFVYGLLVLRTVRGQENESFVPQVSITVAMMLAVASLFVLIYFIHHVASSISASQIVGTASDELNEVIDRLFPEHLGRDARTLEEEPPGVPVDIEWTPVLAPQSGYVAAIDADRLFETAERAGGIVRLCIRPGDFVSAGMRLAELSGRPARAVVKGIAGAVPIERSRSTRQDPLFAVNQLVEISLRALSPGINDPFTALDCLDRLGEGLERVSHRAIPSPQRFDKQGHLRVLAPAIGFGELADAAFDQLRHYASSNPEVLSYMLVVFGRVAARVHRDRDRAALRKHAGLVLEAGRQGLTTASDRNRLEARYEELASMLAGNSDTHDVAPGRAASR